jgi:phage repressor protein C with HTH and peptisase S24 domain
MNLKDRLKTFISHLNIDTKAFEKNANLSNGFVNNIGDGIRKRSLDNISIAYPSLNTSWLLTGEGNMLKDKNGSTTVPITQNFVEGSIPLYDIEINAGTVTRIIDDNNTVPLAGWLYLKDNPNTTGLIGVRAKGDSMSTFIDGGDIMLIRRLRNFDFIPPGHAYVVISDELSIVKYLRNGKDENHWTLRSHNKNYEDFTVKRSSIKHLFIVVKVLKELSY